MEEVIIETVSDKQSYSMSYQYAVALIAIALHVYMERIKNFQRHNLSPKPRDAILIQLALLQTLLLTYALTIFMQQVLVMFLTFVLVLIVELLSLTVSTEGGKHLIDLLQRPSGMIDIVLKKVKIVFADPLDLINMHIKRTHRH